ncbi:hypothetical protein [Aeromicrobium duanguangcaii]|uniref:Uncharacterized protein n=1 Tax=Aeromicrobium duanguangcaii TaxID=2968086 RepID=A0ABY5KHI8_9ACTN|nr:hypothetical protein [Aeromicrobium duanguangcaii]MCD9152948.1 hypothetical protein [Aeromicrobium duanguangcaii]UUI69946.1 hypothetical protein NP095_07585 [Aeromicrobium duanguangcaii]
MGIKAYGVGAATSVAIGNAETAGGKGEVALKSVPTLANRYHDAKFVVEHREEIQSALDYLENQTPEQVELQATLDKSSGTLRSIETTYEEFERAQDSLPDPIGAAGHFKEAWDAKPDLDSIRQLVDTAEKFGPLSDKVEILVRAYYRAMSAAVDNFASDEIVATITVMALSMALAFAVGRAVGFWVRRGRPGFLARALQRLGARRFRGWYVRNLEYALGDPVYEAARERMQRDVAANPEDALDEETLKDLEDYFAIRLRYATTR